MQLTRKATLSRKLQAAFCLVMVLSLALAGSAGAQSANPPSANRGSPAADCAVVTSMPGFPEIKASSLLEKDITLKNEGVVIRESTIKDGKIIIPPSGIYYTIRTGGMRWPLVNYPVMILGKQYYVADIGTDYGRLTDVVMKKGDRVPYGRNMSALELSSIGTSWPATPSNPTPELYSATFQVLKPSGNYYGSSYSVASGDKYARSTTDGLAGKEVDRESFYQEDLIATTGTAYLVADKITKDSVTVSMWETGEIVSVDVAPTAWAKTAAVNDVLELGKYKVKVTAIDNTAGTAKVSILDGDKVVAEKTLGPLTEQVVKLFPSVQSEKESLLLKYEDVEVALSAMMAPFKEAGKVGLVGYSDIVKMKVTEPWPLDPKWILYFDT